MDSFQLYCKIKMNLNPLIDVLYQYTKQNSKLPERILLNQIHSEGEEN